MSVAFGGQHIAWQGIWDETFAEDMGWLRTSSGVRNGVLKLIPTVIDWYKECTGPLSQETKNFRNFLKDCKNIMALSDLPEKTCKFANSIFKLYQGPSHNEGFWGSADLTWRTTTSAAGVITPIFDIAEAVDARVFPIEAETLQWLKTFNSAGMILASTDGAVKNITRIWRAVHAIQAHEAPVTVYDLGWRARLMPIDLPIDPQMVIELSLIDLAKCISYIALGAILLISACFTAIPPASFWILLSSSSGLTFTIIGEFYQRYCRGESERYRNGNPRYPYLPDVAQETVAEQRARLRIRH